MAAYSVWIVKFCWGVPLSFEFERSRQKNA
jgi:hypothetical protein